MGDGCIVSAQAFKCDGGVFRASAYDTFSKERILGDERRSIAEAQADARDLARSLLKGRKAEPRVEAQGVTFWRCRYFSAR